MAVTDNLINNDFISEIRKLNDNISGFRSEFRSNAHMNEENISFEEKTADQTKKQFDKLTAELTNESTKEENKKLLTDLLGAVNDGNEQQIKSQKKETEMLDQFTKTMQQNAARERARNEDSNYRGLTQRLLKSQADDPNKGMFGDVAGMGGHLMKAFTSFKTDWSDILGKSPEAKERKGAKLKESYEAKKELANSKQIKLSEREAAGIDDATTVKLRSQIAKLNEENEKNASKMAELYGDTYVENKGLGKREGKDLADIKSREFREAMTGTSLNSSIKNKDLSISSLNDLEMKKNEELLDSPINSTNSPSTLGGYISGIYNKLSSINDFNVKKSSDASSLKSTMSDGNINSNSSSDSGGGIMGLLGSIIKPLLIGGGLIAGSALLKKPIQSGLSSVYGLYGQDEETANASGEAAGENMSMGGVQGGVNLINNARATTSFIKGGAKDLLANRGAGMGAMALGKSALKSGAKALPFGFGLAASLPFAAERIMKEGDWTGAGLDVASGLVSAVPGIGTAAGAGITGYGLYRDYQRGASGESARARKEHEVGPEGGFGLRKDQGLMATIGGPFAMGEAIKRASDAGGSILEGNIVKGFKQGTAAIASAIPLIGASLANFIGGIPEETKTPENRTLDKVNIKQNLIDSKLYGDMSKTPNKQMLTPNLYGDMSKTPNKQILTPNIIPPTPAQLASYKIAENQALAKEIIKQQNANEKTPQYQDRQEDKNRQSAKQNAIALSIGY